MVSKYFTEYLANELDFVTVEYAVQQGSYIEGFVGTIIFKTPELISKIETK
ncbi:MAG: hypothetical protein AB2794_13910 [Candidatus Thiodiazotropha endolucinida]